MPVTAALLTEFNELLTSSSDQRRRDSNILRLTVRPDLRLYCDARDSADAMTASTLGLQRRHALRTTLWLNRKASTADVRRTGTASASASQTLQAGWLERRKHVSGASAMAGVADAGECQPQRCTAEGTARASSSNKYRQPTVLASSSTTTDSASY